MYYITVRQRPAYRQMTLDEFLFGTQSSKPVLLSKNETNTKTYEVKEISDKFLQLVDIPHLITKLIRFNEIYECLRNKPREDLYYTFHIKKASGGLRRIDAPEPELMDALRHLKSIFEEDFGALYHTSAFAYIKKRCTLDAVKRHQSNESKWFGKYDLSNFFGNTTLDFVMKMFSVVFPFSEVCRYDVGRNELKKALELAFYNGGLPQGTPISPIITNIMMIPIDFTLNKGLRNFNNQNFVYTRYADDFLISSKHTFDSKEVERFIVETLAKFEAPFTIKPEKTRYGSSAGRNWNLGVMLNKDNEITIGHKKKKQFKAMLSAYAMDKKNGKSWDLSDIQIMEGYRNYYRMVEGENIDAIVNYLSEKFDIDIVKSIKDDLSS